MDLCSNANVAYLQDILACVVKNLFEEYRFFHEYPERELRTTAEVYGSIIREGVISYVLSYFNLLFVNTSFI